MRSLDVHTHILPPELPRWAPVGLERTGECRARMLLSDGTFFREIESNCWDPARRMSECDAAGVGVQVLNDCGKDAFHGPGDGCRETRVSLD